MKRTISSGILLCLATIGSIAPAQEPAFTADRTIWYAAPAKDWNTQALHIGNGYMGASFYGDVKTERLDIAEKTFWAGKPSERIRLANGQEPGGKEKMREIQQEVIRGNYAKADALTAQYISSDRQGFGHFSNVGQMQLSFSNHDAPVTGYRRGVDLTEGYGFVKYQCGETNYLRTYFCSYPDKVMALRLSADRPGSISFSLSHTFTHPVATSAYDGEGLWTIEGKIKDNGQQYAIRIYVENKGGDIRRRGDTLTVDNADEVRLYYAIDTEYLQNAGNYRGVHPDKTTKSVIKDVRRKGYQKIWENHRADFGHLSGQVQFALTGDSLLERLPTDQRIAQFKRGSTDDGALKTLWFNFGRYMMISASRAQTLPSNLQGAWNAAPQAAWGGNYQSNINLQEMYWSCGALRLDDCELSYINWIKDLVPSGRKTAQTYYGSRGWVSHATGSIWGHTTPGSDILWGIYPAAAAWHCRHLWMHYVYTRDRKYLQEVYPVMREAAEFWADNLVEKDGHLMVIPSVSAEHGIQVDAKGQPVAYTNVNGEGGRKLYTVPAFQDIAMVRNLLADVCKAAEALDRDAAMRDSLSSIIGRMQPFKVGKYGQLQEWLIDADNPRDHHRHIAHLYAMFPGDLISLHTTPELAKAVEKSLLLRGSGKSGDRWPHAGGNWSMIWRTALWTRLHDGEQAIRAFNTMMRESGYENMGSNQSGRFMVDAIMATPGVFADMIAQAEGDRIYLLPALPAEWPEGSMKGMRLPGGYLIDIEWKYGRPQSVAIHTPQGAPAPKVWWNGKEWNGATLRGMEKP